MTSIAGKLARQNERAEGMGTNKNAVKFCNQDYSTLKTQCLQKGRLFEDDTFPAGSSSLGFNILGPNSSETQGVVWKRPKELCKNPCFIDNGATRTDICQGQLGDCWLMAAIASLTLDQEILARVVPPGQSFQENYAGIFHFQFWQFGDWIDVVIDDKLPTRNGKLVFVHSSQGSEFWSALLEKAYAKLNGCYEALSGGSATEGFEDFTGGISEKYELKNAPSYLFKVIQRALQLGSLLACAIEARSSNEREAITPLKLVKGHAYSLTAAEEVHYQGKTVELVRLRNPWGNVEWTGPWSDSSGEWNRILPEEKAKLVNVAEDGEFWMAFSDFLQSFATLEICNLTPDTLTSDKLSYWNHYQFSGQWKVGSTAGGCLNFPATFCSNPQYAIKLEDVDDDPFDGEDRCTLLVGLMQKDGRKQKKLGIELNYIGFTIFKFKGRTDVHLGQEVLLRNSPVARNGSFINAREACTRFHLPPGEYIIIPSTFDANMQGSFLLRVFTEKQAIARSFKCIFQPKLLQSHTDPDFKTLFNQTAGNVSTKSEVSVFQLIQVLNNILSRRSKIKTAGFSLNTCRDIVSLLDKDGNGKLNLEELHVLWQKIQKYLEVFQSVDTDNSGTMSTHEMREALAKAGFQVNNAVLQAIVSRYAGPDFSINFDSFVSCLIRLEMLYKMFTALDGKKTGKIELDMLKVGLQLDRPAFCMRSSRCRLCKG
uniref:Calpain-2 catalytic subunit-like n=1 Tax=Scleropages formosus TaxID=113540 RepID=A0A8C9UZ75_SCLFO